MQIRQCFECYLGMSMIANEEMLAGNADHDATYSYPNADPSAS